MPDHVTSALLDNILAAFNNHDADTIANFFAEDGVMFLAIGKEPFGTALQGPAKIRAALQTRFANAPDLRWTEGKSWIFGSKALSEWRMRGTTADGATIDVLGCDLWEFEGGKIKKKDIYYKQRV